MEKQFLVALVILAIVLIIFFLMNTNILETVRDFLANIPV